MRNKATRLTLWLLVFICLAPTAIARERWQNSAYITQSFTEVALGSEFGQAKQVVRKWVKPIRLFVTHQVGDQALHEKLLDAHIEHLAAITGHDIKRVSSAKQANIRLFFTRESMLLPLIRQYSGKASVQHERGSVCLASIRTNAADEIVAAVIYIPVDRARRHAKLLACIVEELTQTLGLPRDSDAVFPSIFNDKTVNYLLTGLDDILLRMLYDPRMLPGTDRREILKISPHILSDLEKRGLIENATLRVKSEGALYQYF
ncbi:DUF2927 domain-containing protein [Neptunomonas qingdaonensis]|uniref:DUF2927 domain-containing protein n=1 Tax=Neptunomonas qingdaonensis TaxID=1045558 RepID=A0A1I2M3W2_9GAMM|nr:DUF2927 domain-containing protein [Neptunomonas qingdaonensis]SFF86212.1 Protein of unknown function [Neptunomonas qingdaonensis]